MAFKPTSGTKGTRGSGKIKVPGAGKRTAGMPAPLNAGGPGKPRGPRIPREPGTRPDVGPPRVTNFAKGDPDYGVQNFAMPFGDSDRDGE